MVKTFESCYFGLFIQSLADVNKRLAKLQQPAIEVLSSTEEIRKRGNLDERWTTVTLSDPVMVRAGRDVRHVGTVSFEQGVKGIYSTDVADELGIVLGTIKDEDLRCDHCKTNRSRSKYQFFFGESGLVSIGSSCARDYFGFDVEAAIKCWFDLKHASFDDEMLGGRYARGNSIFDLVIALDWATHGFTDAWISRAKAEETDGTPTSSKVWPCLNADLDEFKKNYGKDEVARYQEIRAGYAVDTHVMERALDKVVAEWKDLTPKTDFDFNMKANLFNEDGTIRTWIVRPAVALYGIYKALHVVIESVKKSNEWVGTVGKREVFEVKVLEMKSFDTQYGTSCLVMMEDSAGNSLKTFSSGSFAGDIKAGETVRIKATVKSFEDYKGRRQTMLSRAAVQKL